MATDCNKLTEIAEETRKRIMGLNVYNSIQGTSYGSTHPNALANEAGTRDPANIKGKGTGVFMDTYNGGGSEDIKGNGKIPGSGRIANTIRNKYTTDKRYQAPDLGDRTLCPTGIAGIGSL